MHYSTGSEAVKKKLALHSDAGILISGLYREY